jgi:hypothetical protein
MNNHKMYFLSLQSKIISEMVEIIQAPIKQEFLKNQIKNQGKLDPLFKEFAKRFDRWKREFIKTLEYFPPESAEAHDLDVIIGELDTCLMFLKNKGSIPIGSIPAKYRPAMDSALGIMLEADICIPKDSELCTV